MENLIEIALGVSVLALAVACLGWSIVCLRKAIKGDYENSI